MTTNDLITGLPGESRVREGRADAQAGRCTTAACLVSIGRRRLNRAGLLASLQVGLPPEPERCLYRLLRTQGGDAYSRYNALLRELVSFEQALDWRMRKNSTLHGSVHS